MLFRNKVCKVIVCTLTNFLVCPLVWMSKYHNILNFSFSEFWPAKTLFSANNFYCQFMVLFSLWMLEWQCRIQSFCSLLSIRPSSEQCYVEEALGRAPHALCTCIWTPACTFPYRARPLRVQQRGLHPRGLARHSGDSQEQEEGRPPEGGKIRDRV